MRVYDAQSGDYLWQGNLNFVTAESGDPRQQTALRMTSRSVLRRVGDAAPPTIESRLIVQAVDRITGRPIWRQLFSPKKERSERVAMESQADRLEAETDNCEYEVIVRSYDRETEQLVWTDRLSTSDVIDEVSEDEAERAQLIPGWPVHRSLPGKLWAWNASATVDESGSAYE
jgi:hypothetical protein